MAVSGRFVAEARRASGLVWRWLGRQRYRPFLERMQARARAIASGGADEVLWFCEHEPVYTTGHRGIRNLKGSAQVEVIRTDRGGETTYHGPGQLMMYPVLDLRRHGLGVRAYVTLLEQSVIDLAAGFGVAAGRRSGAPGVWAGEAKLAALGVRIRRGVAYHGVGLNVSVAPEAYAPILPCGLDLPVTSLARLGVSPAVMPELAARWAAAFNALLAAASRIYTPGRGR